MWNNLDGDRLIVEFEKKWYEWNVNDTIKWFEFVLNTRNIDDIRARSDLDLDYKIEDYSDTSDISDSDAENNDQMDHNDEKP